MRRSYVADNKQTPPSPAASKDDDFDKRHAKELGAARFAKVQTTYAVVPLAAGGAGWALGNYALAAPVAKMAPGWNKSAGAVEVVGSKAKKAISDLWAGKSPAEAFSEFSLTGEQLGKIGEAWKDEGLSYKGKSAAIADIMKLELPKVSATVRHTTAGVAGFTAFVAGSIATGYDKWHKEESARIAAQEVNKDISQIELFKPSDAELVAENKRLRAIVAKMPSPDVVPASVKLQGKVQEKQTSAAKG